MIDNFEAPLFFYDDEDAVLAKEVEKNFYHYDNRLYEIAVDPGYELEQLSKKDKYFLEMLRRRFINRSQEPIPFYEIKMAIYKIADDHPDYRVSLFQTIHMLRYMWRAGEIRRFVRGKSRRTQKRSGRGEWYGVHYILFPEEVTQEN